MKTADPSRPLRSLALFLVSWVLLRALTIWSGEILGKDVQAAPAPAQMAILLANAQGPIVDMPTRTLNTQAMTVKPGNRPTTTTRLATRRHILSRSVQTLTSLATPVAATNIGAVVGLGTASIVSIPSPAAHPAMQTSGAHSRWSGSAWLLVRRGGPEALGTAGELGGSQAGARLLYEIDHKIAATGRVSRALAHARGGEASIGIAIRHRNMGLLLERRFALDGGGRNAFSATAYGGVSDVAIVHGVHMDGYAQAGIVGTDKFIDGAVRVERTMATLGQVRISAGAGLWGGAQPRVERVDAGPQIVARVPVEGHSVRISTEWRERVAGRAAPGSGPSLTVGIDL